MSSVVPVIVPRENVNDETVKIIRWRVSEGDSVEAEQLLVEVETSKATFDVPSPARGVVRQQATAGREVPIGDVLCYVAESNAEFDQFHPRQQPGQNTSAAPAVFPGDGVDGRSAARADCATAASNSAQAPVSDRISEKASALIRARGLDESEFAGRGLVRERDVLAFLGEVRPNAPLPFRELTAEVPAPRPAVGVRVRSEELPRAKRVETKLLSWGQRQAIRSAVVVTVSMHSFDGGGGQCAGIGESLSTAVLYEAARLLRKYPRLNAYCAGETVNFYEEINIGYALDADNGLKVPVIRNADAKGLPELVDERRRLLADYLDDAIRPEALAGATFSISDLSGDGVWSFDPLIVEGQAAILGIGSPSALPRGDAAYNLILAFDHRLVEGRMAARFLSELKRRLEAHSEALHADPSSSQAADEPYCSLCMASLGDVKQMQGFLLQAAGTSPADSQLICSICLAGL
jgi:pyruvate/2-oxoglutarate dehydrogenase complex dihydrolipoamide acyltransferase (E2) component